MKKAILIDVISYAFAFLFVYTAVSKFFILDIFLEDIQKISIIKSFAPIITLLIPILEILVSLCLIIPNKRLLGLYSSFILMVVFTLYVAGVLLFTESKYRPCTCGGVIRELTWKQHLWLNTGLTLLSFAGIILQKKNNTRPHLIGSASIT